MSKFFNFLLILIFEISLINSFGETEFLQSRIINGLTAIDTQFPWYASVIRINATSDKQLCGGSLISKEWILTAAHCVKNGVILEIGMGSINISTPTYKVNSSEWIIHPDYNSTTKNHDIALVYLPVPVNISDSIQIIELPTKSMISIPFINDIGQIPGHGRLQDDGIKVSQILKWIYVRILSNSDCMSYYDPNVIVPSTMCTLSLNPKNQSICGGDSGGGLIITMDQTYYLIGVAAFTPINSCLAGPAGFIRTTSHLDWISEITNLKIKS